MADKTIGELTEAAAIDDTSKIPGEQQGGAVYYTGKLLKDYAASAAAGYATAASGFADAANAAASAAADLKNLAGEAASEAEVQAEAAAEARQAIENMAVEAIGLDTGDPATVNKELVDGVVKLIFGIPRGERGEKGAYPDITESVKGMVLTAGEKGLPVWKEAPESLPDGGASGQVLTKKSGADGDAEWADLPSGLPEVTAADNGKFLRVVNGVWAAEAVQSAEGVSF
jgi:hypothetical protein